MPRSTGIGAMLGCGKVALVAGCICEHRAVVHPIWPLFDLRVRTPRLELRAIDDERAVRLARLAVAGIHEGPSPFRFPWNEGEPDEVMRRAMQHYWGTRASWTPEAWHMPFAVEVDGEVVGTQGIAATGFAVRWTVGSGSWLGKAHQGRGLGRENAGRGAAPRVRRPRRRGGGDRGLGGQRPLDRGDPLTRLPRQRGEVLDRGGQATV